MLCHVSLEANILKLPRLRELISDQRSKDITTEPFVKFRFHRMSRRRLGVALDSPFESCITGRSVSLYWFDNITPAVGRI
jgi:hypothetical protein